MGTYRTVYDTIDTYTTASAQQISSRSKSMVRELGNWMDVVIKSLRRSVPSALARLIFGLARSQSLQNKRPRDGWKAMPRELTSCQYLMKLRKSRIKQKKIFYVSVEKDARINFPRIPYYTATATAIVSVWSTHLTYTTTLHPMSVATEVLCNR